MFTVLPAFKLAGNSYMSNALYHKSKPFPTQKLLLIKVNFTIQIKFRCLDPRYLGMKY